MKVELSDRTLLAKNGKLLTNEQFNKKMAITARALANGNYTRHKIVY